MSTMVTISPGTGKGRMRYRIMETFNEAYRTKDLSAVTA